MRHRNLIALTGWHLLRKWNYHVKIIPIYSFPVEQKVGFHNRPYWLANSLRGGWAPFFVAQIPIFRQGHLARASQGQIWGQILPHAARWGQAFTWGDPIQTNKTENPQGEIGRTFNWSKCLVFFCIGMVFQCSMPNGYSPSLWFLQHADRSFKTPIAFTALQLQFHMLSELLAKFRSQLQWITTTSSTPKNLHKRLSLHKWFLRIASAHVKQIRSKLYQATVSRTQMPHCLEESDAVRFLTLSWLAQKDTSLKHIGRLLMVFWQTGACSIVGVGIEWSIFIAWGRLER